MNDKPLLKKRKWHNSMAIYVLAVGTIAFVTLLSPNYVSFKYKYDLNRPWKYEDIYAQTDMILLKSPEQLAEEKAAIEDNFPPHYVYHPAIEKQQIEAYEKRFKDDVELAKKSTQVQYKDVIQKPAQYRTYGADLLSRFYRRGIIKVHDPTGEQAVVEIVRGNSKAKKTLQSLTTVAEAQSMIKDSLMYSQWTEADFLAPITADFLTPNLLYSDSITQQYLQLELDQLSTSDGMIQQGEIIVAAGQAVTPPVYNRIRSYEAHYLTETSTRFTYWVVWFGYLLIFAALVLTYLLYLRNTQYSAFSCFNTLAFLLMWFVVYSYLVYFVEQLDVVSTYIIPFCIAPIVIKNFFNDRLAMFTHLVIVLIAGFLSTLGFEFIFLQMLAGIVAVLTNTETRYWSRFFMSILYIFIAYVVGYMGLVLIQGANWSDIDGQVIGFLFANTVLLLLAYPLIPLLEKLFGFISTITLAELADLNRDLLKELSLKAPGTFQHSLQVANLSEAAARRIGANALLVKTAALYHDIGKIQNPQYFIENQGAKNPHLALSDIESAQILIQHVPDGVRMAKKNRLPSVIIDFIKTHHGTTRTEYFYRNYIKQHPDEPVDESLFRYAGPKPTTKEQTIMMIADSLEAASKTLSSPTGEDIDELIEAIVAGKIRSGQFEESDLTFEELELCKEEFQQLLRSINHVRIEYPDEQP